MASVLAKNPRARHDSGPSPPSLSTPVIPTQTFAPGSWGTGPPFSGWYDFSESWTFVYLNEQNTPHSKTKPTKQTITTKQTSQSSSRQARPSPSPTSKHQEFDLSERTKETRSSKLLRQDAVPVASARGEAGIGRIQ